MTDEQIFDRAIRLEGDLRVAFLRDACGKDAQQQERIAALVAAHEQGDSLLDTQAMAGETETVINVSSRKTIGDFEIVGELGRGGMGVVYEAHQKSLRRKVALKVLSSGLGLSSKAILRFRREAEAAGKLHHTNIVPIYTTGEDKGIHYYAMELIDGPSLDAVIRALLSEPETCEQSAASSQRASELPDWVKETALFEGPGGHRRPDVTTSSGGGTMESTARSTIASGSAYFDQVATMIADVADALDHAHEHGVVHRDIKPSNLLLGPDGRLSINDFGLARMLEQPGMTMSGEFVGSPLYMSPEQITAGRVAIDHRTDIYSLGATLYELLALRPPFPGQTRDQVLSQILHKEAVSTRKLNRRVPVDLDTICMKAIDKDPDRRYQTAGALAEDLRRYVHRHAISARRLGPIGATIKYAKRNPVTAILVLFVALTLTAAGFVTRSIRQGEIERARKETASQIENSQRNAYQLIFMGDLSRAGDEIDEAERLGADLPWCELSRALIDVYVGDHDRAALHLQNAHATPGHELKKKAMAAIVQFHTGDEASYFESANQLAEEMPKMDQDHLFLGLALTWAYPGKARDRLTDAAKLRPGLQTAIKQPRCYALWQVAMDAPRADPQSANEAIKCIEQAIDDAEDWLEAWPHHTFTRSTLVQAHLTAADVYEDAGRLEDREKHIEDAVRELELIDQFPERCEEAFARYFTLDYTGQRMKALNYIREAEGSVMVGKTYAAAYSLIACFSLGDETDVESFYENSSETVGQLKSSFVVLVECSRDSDSTGRRGLDWFENSIEGKRTAGEYAHVVEDWMAYRLLGASQTEAAAHVRQARDHFERFDAPMQHDVVHVCDYLAGDRDDESVLLSRCGHSRRALSTAHFSIGARAIIDGDRGKAERAFESCIDQHVFQYYVHQLSLAFLDRLRAPDSEEWLKRFRSGVAAPPSDSQDTDRNDTSRSLLGVEK